MLTWHYPSSTRSRPMEKRLSQQEQQRQEELKRRQAEKKERKRLRREELNIKLPEPLKPWAMKKTLSKKVIPYFERGVHPLVVAKKLRVNPNTVRSYWWRWRRNLGI